MEHGVQSGAANIEDLVHVENRQEWNLRIKRVTSRFVKNKTEGCTQDSLLSS